jgi:hypothetical protein
MKPVSHYCTVIAMPILFMASIASGELRATDYPKLVDQAWFKPYIGGVGMGYMWANAKMVTLRQPGLFCAPAKLGLRQENYVDLLDSYLTAELRKGVKPDTILLEPLLLDALQDAFPCKTDDK